MKINYERPVQRPKRKPKRMLEIRPENGRIRVMINFSSLDIIQTCMKKAYLSLDQKLIANTEHPATVVGRAVHKALEFWYKAGPENKRKSDCKTDDAISELMARYTTKNFNGINELCHGNTQVGAINAMLDEARDLLGSPLLMDTARNLPNIVAILQAYFDQHTRRGDFFLAAGSRQLIDLGFPEPLAEKAFELKVASVGNYDIYLHGCIDLIAEHTETNELIVIDHKTTSSIGKDFRNRLKPNFQYTGYYWAARDFFGIPVKKFYVNAIQVAKTRQSFERHGTKIFDSDIDDLKEALVYNVLKYCSAKEVNMWPMSTPNACSMWGSCQYKEVCETPASLRKNIIAASYGRNIQ